MSIKKYFIVLLSLVMFSELKSQTSTKYWIQFKNKGNSAFSLSSPSSYLSQRAIARRANQGIAIDSTDLPVNTNYLNAVQASGATVLYTSKWFNAVVAIVPNASVLNTINQLSFVQNTTPTNLIKKKIDSEYNLYEPISNTAKSLQLNYGAAQNQIQMLNGICLHDSSFTGNNIHIALLDAGFRRTHIHSAFDSIRNSGRILGTKDFVWGGSTDVYADSTSTHGTSVFSCMAANLPGQMIGTAPHASYWLLRSEYAQTELIIEEFNWVAAIEYADSVGVDIINSSLGYTTFDIIAQNHTLNDLNGKVSFASRAATLAARKGMIVCNSAGNSGGTSWQKIGIPADADSILTVGAVNSSGIITSFSSTGPSTDGRLKPEVVAQGGGTTIINPLNAVPVTGNGTSFSSPVLAGMVACLWQANPSKTNMEVIDAIKQSASKFQTPDNSYGYGIPDFCLANLILKGQNSISNINVTETSLNVANSGSNTSEFSILFKSLDSQKIDISIYDINGKLLLKESKEVKAQSVNTFNVGRTLVLNSGVYFVVINGNKEKWTKKFSIN